MTEQYLRYKPQYIGLPEQSNWTCYMFGNRPGGMGFNTFHKKDMFQIVL